MKVIILAGGLGTRFSEETENKPKPMILVNGKPILWHIMTVYAKHGFDEFIIATGYKAEIIDSWVSTLNEPWSVETVFSGIQTQTGGRVRACMESYEDSTFLVTYGDGLGNIDIRSLVREHTSKATIATVTAVRPPARFGFLNINESNLVTHFGEKNQLDEGWINGGFFVFEREILDFIGSDSDPLETKALPTLASQGQLNAYLHSGFWQPMDTRSERNTLENLAREDRIPWLV